MGREREVRNTTGNSADDSGKEILGCSSATSNTVLRAELGVYPLETNGDARKLK